MKQCSLNHIRDWFQLLALPCWIRPVAASLALAVCAALSVQPAPVTVTGGFTTFTSYLGTDRTSYVNGSTALTASATQVGPNRFQSNTVNFGASIPTVNFNYDFNFPPPTGNAWLVNTFEFIAAPSADVVAGQTFQLGTIRFTNGQWWEQADLGFVLTSHSADPTLDGHTFQGTLRLISVSAIPHFVDPLLDAMQEADYFYVLERPDLGSMRVFDKIRQPPGNPGFTGEFAIDGRIGSLILTDFASLNLAGFTDSSTQPGLSETVPEPGTLMLLGAGLTTLWAFRKRRK